jgi:hypothetical protein
MIEPTGEMLAAGSPGAEITDLNCGRILTVASPEAGTWRAEITGHGRFWMEAKAQSEIYFIAVEFVKPGGRPGHEGLFRIAGQPVAGSPATLQASMSAQAAKTTEFSLVTDRGQTIQKLHMEGVNSDREFLEFVGSVQLPDVPFRVAVTGLDLHEKPYQRYFAPLFHAESVEVSTNPTFIELNPGDTKQIEITVRNIGAARTFNVTAADAHRFVSDVEPKELVLDAGASGTVRVGLTVPEGTAPGVGDDLVILARSTSGPPTSNSNIVHCSVFTPSAPQKTQ